MSKRNMEYEDYNDGKRQKINENNELNNSSPLLFFEDNYMTTENNNVCEMFYDISCQNGSNGEEHYTVEPENKINEINLNSNGEIFKTEAVLNLEPTIENIINKKNDNLYEMENFNDCIVNATIISNVELPTIDVIVNENFENINENQDLKRIITEKDKILNNTAKDIASNNEQVNEAFQDLPAVIHESINKSVDNVPELNNKEIKAKKTLVEEVKPSYRLRSSIGTLEVSDEEKKDRKRNSTRVKMAPLKMKKVSINEENISFNDKDGVEIARDLTTQSADVTRRKSLRSFKRANIQKENLETQPAKIEMNLSTPNSNLIQEMDDNDPGTWPEEIPGEMKIKLLKKGPVQLELTEYPRDERNRCFPALSYFSKNSKNESIRRYWLVYSANKDAAYCFPCRIFGYDSQSSLANSGSRNWKKLQERINCHQESTKHKSCMEQWAQFPLDSDNSKCGLSLTHEEALKLAGQLKHFSSTTDYKIYLLAKQLETELLNFVRDEGEETRQK